jgi:acetyltransferase-like isoleucine patch superfamily enzyme
MRDVRRWLALSDHPLAGAVRKLRRSMITFSLPAPAVVVRPLLAVFLALRGCYYFLVRIFVCEPLFKAYCAQYGKGLRTGVYVHWVQGKGRLVFGNNILVDGKCSFSFAMRYAESPVLSVGSNSILSHGCSFTVGREITIGEHCLIAMGVLMFDAPGHPTDPVLRKMGSPANMEDVRPIRIHDNVWIGRNAIIFPGVTIGEGSVVVMGSLVMNDVPPYSIVAGNPARVIGQLSGAPRLQQDAGTPNRNQTSTVPVRSSSLSAVMGILQNALGTPELAEDEDFYDAGLTSIMVLPLLVDIEQQFGVTFLESDLLDARTGRGLAMLIDTQNGGPLANREVA